MFRCGLLHLHHLPPPRLRAALLLSIPPPAAHPWLPRASEYPLYSPVEPPHRSAAAAAVLAQAADFDFSFVSSRNNWNVCDVRDSRVLLSTRHYPPEPFQYLVVCDPLHRRYATIPGIPGDLWPSSQQRGLRLMEFEPFLDPVSEKEKWEEGDDLPFRVICNVMYESKFVTLVFSFVTGKWQPATSFSYEYTALVRHYAHSCFYWTHVVSEDMLVLDPLDMKFSVVNLPPSIYQGWQAARNERAIVDAGEGRLGLLVFGSDKRCLDLYLKTMGNNGIGTEDWQHYKTIHLPNCH
ncbi:hypothetical protein PR202_gb24256 [Eleusine coracana subsp. coracana]|uniref:Uncharacterized protein n=1 Tax=Eleusine coracana subsp. coracana TaxID=191504 RepID=A0AAV5FM28_ELECO|nr:hypothetical protein PR202_gb24256 [Eleusine coracana subsp. coracana]